MDTANEAPNNVESSEPNENGNISNEDEEVFATSGGNGDITTAKFKLSQVRRQNAQKNAFTRWLNSKLKQGDYTSQIVITDLFRDLTDGNILLSLLESLTGRKMRRIKGSMKLHHLNNVNLALGLLKDYQVKLVNIGNTDIVDGKPIPTLGLIWSMIYRFQIQGALIDIHPGDNDRSSFEDQNVEQTILDWCSKGIQGYEGVDVTNFSTSWKDGLAFNALIHRYKPNLFHYETALTKSPAENLEHAFTVAETAFAVPRLLEPTDLQHDPIDSRLVVMYVSTLYEKLRELDPKEDDTVTCEEIEEFLSYIQTEMNYLTSCEEYFMTCSNIEDLTDDEEIIKEYQELQGLIESLQPHEIKVGELVRQIEKLIKVELIPEEDCQALQVELDKLKELWQDVFDRTTARHDKLCKRMSNLVDKPLKSAYDSLNEYKDRLKDFSNNETDLQNAWQQYTNLLAFIEELRSLENDIEDIRTGSEVGGALGALSEQDEHLVSDNIKELITSFMELGESVADAKYRISENLHEVLRGNMENIENVLMTTQEATEKEANNNNNLETEDVKKRLQILKDIENALLDTKRDLDHVTSICESLDESFSIDDVSAVELKNHAGELDEEYIEQHGCLHGLIEQAQHQLEGQDKLENWKKDVETTMVWIREKQRELESMDDLESSLHMLEDAAFKIESLYSEISNYQEKIDGVVQVGVKFVQDEEKDTASTPSIQSDIRSLEDTWELLREKCTAIQLSIQERMLVKQSEEREYMAEWHETCTKIDDWLTNAENQVALFAKARELICDVEDQVAEHEELVFRLATEEKTISDHLEAGEILSQQKIRQQDNKLRVKTELKALKKRRNKLNARLVGQQESLTSYLDHLTRMETEEFEAWLEKSNAVKKSLSELDKEEHNKSIDSVDEARTSIAAEEAFIAEVEGFQSDVDEVVDNAQSLIADGKMGKLRRQTMRSSIKSLEELYEEKRRAAATRLREVSEELLHLQHQEEEKISSWMNKIEILHKWIDDEHKQLDATLTKEDCDDDDYTIESIMQGEYAAREIKSNIVSRSTVFESLMNEGERLKCNNTTERYHSEKHAQITELIPVTGNKWNALNTAVNNKLERVASMLSTKQGQLLSICSDQILDLEKLLSAQGPVSDGFDTLVKDCEFISDFLGMVGQAKANMINFNKFAKTMLESVDVANVNKFEIREASEMLQARLNGIEDNSDERKALLHDKIIDVMTEAMVALSDTVGNLEDKYVEINVPDNLDTVDLVERNMNLEDILRRLVACDVSLTDIEILGKAAESCLILETGEGDDITKEIQHRRVFINHVQQLTREKKSRLYGLLVYTFKQRIEEFDKNLTSIEANSQEDGTGMSTDLKTVIERIKNVETSMEQLDVTQKNSDEISMQINDMVDESVLAASDEEEIKILSSKLAEHFPETSESLKSNINGLKQLLKAAVMENLTELQDYLTMMERRREGDDNIGPDSMTIRKQISEMNIVECQMKEKRLTPLLHYEDEIATTYLDSDILFAMKEADRDWLHLSDWMAHRTKVLLSTQEVWEAFRQEEVDLLDMLRDKEKQIKNFEPVNLEEKESVANRLTQLKDMLTSMEEHKDDVSKLHKVADDVIELIGQSSPMSNNIKSQVEDIHDCWNNTVRQIIEAISRLNCAKEMLQNMEAGINEVREWLQSTKSILQFYTNDSPDDMIEDLKPQVMEKCDQEPEKRTTLSKVNSMSRELLDDLDGASCDIMHGDIQVLNNDYDNVIKDLEKKKKMKKRPCYGWCYRRWLLKYGYYN